MTTPNREHFSEFALSLFSAKWLIFPADQLGADGVMGRAEAKASELCHIYLICRRPSCSFDPTTFSFDGKKIKCNLIYKTVGKTISIPFEHPFKLVDNTSAVRISKYPHREIEIHTPEGEVVGHLSTFLMSLLYGAKEKALRELLVLYIGQAYAKGNRSAFERLKNHSTLQKILADILYNNPDDEALILTFEYAPCRALTSFDGTDKSVKNDENDKQRFSNIIDNPPTEHQQICLAEAGLIRYFQPEYNKTYKSSFPASDQKILNECYQLDFSALTVEINTEESNIYLYSPTVQPKTHHIANFDLVDPTKRRSFFNFISTEKETSKRLNVIPPTK